jgi:hypothetical protein
MGILDEAIKDHLELKRRHGADPGEVARLEHEALGPARREPVAEAPVADEPVAAVADEEERVALVEPARAAPAPALDDDDDYADEVPADERLDAPARHVEAEAPAEVEQPTAQFSLEELEQASEEEEEPEREPAHPAGAGTAVAEPEVDESAAGGPAVAEPEVDESEADESEVGAPARAEPDAAEPDPEPDADVVPADDEPDADDVLEETPEFLQETPEHDRLWFEQKPPRDFDF